MMELIPFDKNKLKDFVYNGVDSEICGGNITDIADFYDSLGKGYIGIVDGKIIGVGGCYPLWKGWGTVWLFLNKEARYHKVCIFRGMLNKMNELIKFYDIKIISVQCLDDSLEANRLLHHLGFIKNRDIKMALYGRKIQ